ncbi:MAG: chemotaxis protein CheD [Leptothrix sp. (in: b-proteobacteria)]
MATVTSALLLDPMQVSLPSARLSAHAVPRRPGALDRSFHESGSQRLNPLGGPLVLMPGELYFGSQVPLVRTLLGSCVAITVWHPERCIGGMCHYLLPERRPPRQPSQPLDGRYGDEAMALLVQGMHQAGTEPRDYIAHLYGGADTMPGAAGVKFNIGERNIELGWSLIDQLGMTLHSVDVGDDVPRTVQMAMTTGWVDMQRGRSISQKSTGTVPP